MSIQIIIDSASDISKEKVKEWGVKVLPLKTRFGDEEYLDGITITHEEFFEKLIETDVIPQTSQVSPYDFEQVFEEVKEMGDQALCLTLSSKLSGTYQSAKIAAEDYEDCVKIVDSENVCIGELILVELAVRLRDAGKTLEEMVRILNEEKKHIHVVALLDTLEYLKKGGRISSTTAFVGTMLSIKPVIAIEDGEVKMLGKARGSKNGHNILTEQVEKAGGINFEKPFGLAYSGLSDHMLRKYVKDHEKLYIDHCTAEELPVCTIGSTIGTHVGPGAIAVAFFTK